MSLTFNQTLKLSLPFFLLLSEVFAFAKARKVPSSPSMTEPQTISQNYNWHEFVKFIDIGRGSQVSGVSEIKRYLNRFGYLQVEDKNFTDLFDEELESSIVSYQKFLGLPITGKLDRTTIASIAAPRCGVVDIYPNSSTRISRYTYFSGLPRWDHQTPMTLTYAVSAYYTVDYLSQEVIQAVLRRAFSRWAAVVPINFTEAANYETANIRLGFHSGNHGDGAPFDGVLGVLAHAFMPEDGRLHFDSAETWAVDFETEKSKTAVDLESVAMHEIGHILGLGHSRTAEAIMYPRLKPRRRKLELWVDDVEGIQALYGPNPDFKMSSLMESERSGDSGRRGKDLFIGMSSWCWLVAVLVFGFFLQNDVMMMMVMTSRSVNRVQKQKESNRLGKKHNYSAGNQLG